MLFNAIMIILVIGITVAVIAFYVKSSSKVDNVEDRTKNKYDQEQIQKFIAEKFATTLKENLKELNLSRQQYEQKESLKNSLRSALKEAAYGNRNAKTFIKSYIKSIISKPTELLALNDTNIDRVIAFSSPRSLKSRDKFEIAMYMYSKEYKNNALEQMLKDYNIMAPIKNENGDGTIHYEFTKKRLDEVFDDVISRFPPLSLDDKLNIVAQRIFADYKGFGSADILFDQSIDEIDCGVSGIPEDSYDIIVKDKFEAEYSYESIWIMVHGINIKMSCLSFEKQQELIRICQNIYKFNASEALSRRNGKIVATMKDGSRIVVVRPPFCESWAFFARKFDSTPQIDPKVLLKDDGNFIPLTLMKWFIKGYRTIAITGSQGTGKSTTLKSFVKYIPEDLNLRIQELAFELNLRYTYPKRNIVTFQETDTVSAQDGLDLQKKTNGSVNIIGEVASAEAASWVIQTAMVASLYTIFTHHAKTTRDLVIAIRNNLLETGGYSNEKAAEEMVAQVLNIDMHMEKQKDRRFCQRITEIIPIRDRRYPSEKNLELRNASLNEKHLSDQIEYMHRVTDRQLFETVNLCEWHDGHYVMVHMPSYETQMAIRANLSAVEEELFIKDMQELEKLIQKKDDVRR